MNEVHPKRSYDAGTTGTARRGTYTLYGKKSGHGDMAWVSARRDELGDPPFRPPARQRAVVALLDGDVFSHPWLLEQGGEDFIIGTSGWEQAPPSLVPARVDADEHFGSHLGHATFIAGIIRRIAPAAQVLPIKVMDDRGKVDEEHVVVALDWLINKSPRAVDVVLMALGRRVTHGDDTTRLAKDTKKAIDALAGNGVRVVISAGNGRTCDPVFPASYAREAGNGNGMVVSVGAGVTAAFPEEYSSRGDWVTDWRPGRNVVSIIPLTPGSPDETDGKSDGVGYAKWSGTSFAAAFVAAEFAARLEPVV